MIKSAHRVVREAVRLEHLVRLVKDKDDDAVNVQQPLGHPGLEPPVCANDHLGTGSSRGGSSRGNMGSSRGGPMGSSRGGSSQGGGSMS